MLLLIPAFGAWAWTALGRGAGLIGLPGDWPRTIAAPLRPFMATKVVLGTALPMVSIVGIWALLAIALSRPSYQIAEPSTYTNIAGRVIALDLGAGADIHRQRRAVLQLLDASPQIPTALVVATSDAFDAVPLTTDRAYIERYLSVIKPDVMPIDGRSLYVAMAHSEGVLTRAGIVAGQVVLISGNAPPELALEQVGRWSRALVVVGDDDGWKALAKSIDAVLGTDEDVSAVGAQLQQAIDALIQSDGHTYVDLRPWLIGGAIVLWLVFFRRRRTQ